MIYKAFGLFITDLGSIICPMIFMSNLPDISDYEKQKLSYPDKIAEYFNVTPTQLFELVREIELEKSVLESNEYLIK